LLLISFGAPPQLAARRAELKGGSLPEDVDKSIVPIGRSAMCCLGYLPLLPLPLLQLLSGSLRIV